MSSPRLQSEQSSRIQRNSSNHSWKARQPGICVIDMAKGMVYDFAEVGRSG